MSSSTERAAGGGGPAAPPDRVPASPADTAAEPRRDEAAEPRHEDPERGTDDGRREVVRFLPSGRAGLAPESVTIDREPDAGDDAAVGPHPAAGQRPAAGQQASAGQQPTAAQQVSVGTDVAGAPPWAAEPVGQEPGAPPPWESGPWPSHDSGLPDNGVPESGDWPADARESAYASQASDVGESTYVGDTTYDGETTYVGEAAYGAVVADDIHDPRHYRQQSPGDQAEAAASNRLATGALVAGIAGILVVPGLVLGILGLRRARITGVGTVQSWLGIAASLVWAIGIVVVATLPGGGSSADPGCAGYQSAGASVTRVSSALAAGTPAGQLRSDLDKAAGAVNSAAATAQDMSVRSALSVMTGDLQAALGEVNSGRPVPAVLKTALHHDAAAAGRLCGGPTA